MTQLSTRRSRRYYWAFDIRLKGSQVWQKNHLAFATERAAHDWALELKGRLKRMRDYQVLKLKREDTK